MARRLALVTAALGSILPRAYSAPVPGPDRVTVFRHVHVIPMDRPGVVRDQSVVVRNGVIERVGPAGATPPPPAALVIDGGGAHLIPGLTDFHVHIRAESELLSYLAFGVTTVVNLRGDPSHLALRERVRRGDLLGPTIYTSGPTVDGDPPIWNDDNNRILTDPRDATTVVQEHVAAGYDLVKVYNNLPPDALVALGAAARARGLAVIGHVPRAGGRAEALGRALRAGQAMIAHGEEYFFTHFGGASDAVMTDGPPPEPDVTQIPLVAVLTERSGAAVTPNLSFAKMTLRQIEDLEGVFADPEYRYLDPAVRRLWERANPTRRKDLGRFTARERVKYPFLQKLTRGLADGGVVLLLGTDASGPGMFPGKSAQLELRELQAAGLSTFDALAAATRNAGQFVARHVAGAERFGTVTPGSRADFLLVDGDPLADLSAVERLIGVMVRGRWLSTSEIRAMRSAAGAKPVPGAGSVSEGSAPLPATEGRWRRRRSSRDRRRSRRRRASGRTSPRSWSRSKSA